MATKVMLPKKEYSELREKAKLYKVIKELVFQAPFFEKPAAKNSKEILRALKKLGSITRNFLRVLNGD